MNIILMHTHDTGRYIEPYGYHISTPNLMSLAKEGILFRHAYCAGPTCSPSRAGLLTGMAPHSCGMLGLAHRGVQIEDYSKHLVNLLNQKGYETALCGIQHEAPEDKMIGYKKILTTTEFTRKSSLDWDLSNAVRVVEYLKEKKSDPFFLSFGMFNTHRPFPANDGSVEQGYITPPFPLYDCKENREDMASYCISAKTADTCVGMVLDALRENDLEQNTMVIFTTDHGIAFPKMKCNLYDTGIGVSLIIRMPGREKKAMQVDSLVSHLDIYPTVCEFINEERPSWLQGVSLLPILKGETEKVRNEIFSEVTYHAAYEPMRCIRTERYKLIRFFDTFDNIVYANVDDGRSKNFLMNNGYLNHKREKNMLFDLYFDPVERVNLIEDDMYKEIYQDLSGRMEEWMKKTGDPLLEGKAEKPEGAIVNKISCLSPQDEEFE